MKTRSLIAIAALTAGIASCGPKPVHQPTAIEKEARARLTPRIVSISPKTATEYQAVITKQRETPAEKPDKVLAPVRGGSASSREGFLIKDAVAGPVLPDAQKADVAKRIAAADIVRKKRIADSQKHLAEIERKQTQAAALLEYKQRQANAKMLADMRTQRKANETEQAKKAVAELEARAKAGRMPPKPVEKTPPAAPTGKKGG